MIFTLYKGKGERAELNVGIIEVLVCLYGWKNICRNISRQNPEGLNGDEQGSFRPGRGYIDQI